MMDGITWITCPMCGWYFKPGQGQEPECRCGHMVEVTQGKKWNYTGEQTAEIIEELKTYCVEHYHLGGDVPIECWDHRDWLGFVDECDMYHREPKVCLKELMSVWKERYDAAQDY